MRNKHLLISKAIGCLLFLLTACQENIIYHSYQPINNMGWYRHDTLTYYLDSCLTGKSIDKLQLGIRHTDSYSYQDLWIGILPIGKDSIITERADSLHLYFVDPNGMWKGNGIGETKLFMYEKPYSPKTDTIIGFKVFHIMKDQPLKGINNVGICIKTP